MRAGGGTTARLIGAATPITVPGGTRYTAKRNLVLVLIYLCHFVVASREAPRCPKESTAELCNRWNIGASPYVMLTKRYSWLSSNHIAVAFNRGISPWGSVEVLSIISDSVISPAWMYSFKSRLTE